CRLIHDDDERAKKHGQKIVALFLDDVRAPFSDVGLGELRMNRCAPDITVQSLLLRKIGLYVRMGEGKKPHLTRLARVPRRFYRLRPVEHTTRPGGLTGENLISKDLIHNQSATILGKRFTGSPPDR